MSANIRNFLKHRHCQKIIAGKNAEQLKGKTVGNGGRESAGLQAWTPAQPPARFTTQPRCARMAMT